MYNVLTIAREATRAALPDLPFAAEFGTLLSSTRVLALLAPAHHALHVAEWCDLGMPPGAVSKQLVHEGTGAFHVHVFQGPHIR